MPASNVGALFINIIVFLTSMVNFTDALNHMQPVFLEGLYILSKVFSPRPEDWIAEAAWGDDKPLKTRP